MLEVRDLHAGYGKADVLHGVTMQESGVSKQVATRIEDWPDEPQVRAWLTAPHDDLVREAAVDDGETEAVSFAQQHGPFREYRRTVTARAGTWLENRAEAEVRVPLELAWAMWEDRARIPTWMPWIRRVQVLDSDPALSRWTLATTQFGR